MNFRPSNVRSTAIEAPIDIVWSMLTVPSGWADFFPLRILSVRPPGRAVPGQRVVCESRFQIFPITFEVEYRKINIEQHALTLDVQFPCGVMAQEEIECTALGANRCVVKFRCDFAYPNGWQGAIAVALMSRRLDARTSEWFRRLKREAEWASAGNGGRSSPLGLADDFDVRG